MPRIVLVSACLAGLRTRYDARVIDNPACCTQLASCAWIPVCPEQLGGLPTPRCPAEIVGGSGDDVLDGNARVIDSNGADLSAAFVRGAEMVVAIAAAQQVDEALLKARSPSCGVVKRGVTAALLLRNGITLREFG
ncbi:MAG: DUF523 domain-containing protein [Desulfofustis sp.]